LLDASYAKTRGKELGAVVARSNRNSRPRDKIDFEAIRQLVKVFPRIDLTVPKDFMKVRSRLKFQLAMWVGDAGGDFDKRKTIAEGLLQAVEQIRDGQSWKMYQHLVQTLIAEFKLQE